MSRWEPNARGRLEDAALALYTERGFDQTTVAEIAERAGLTERTYFRHFADKREVLFGGQSQLVDLLVSGIAEAPGTATPLDAVGLGLIAVGGVFDGRRDQARRRQAIVDANPSLRERELIKLASLAVDMTDALRRRGVSEWSARLAAETGMAVFKVAFEQWIAASGQGLAAVVATVLDELKNLTADVDTTVAIPGDQQP
ncbi:TetR/AcrR family transcriptional regulator [Mycobacterium sp. 21AC1]|uniref:TetR/AcrR family transcriptional regulator n=1 Tax=[Mycobacterium] appelbergii TaxID=2939269 RepID=UPI0029392FE5|nr:helix-turn-helix domain-containing protein [Mycobacterium sp. 21AC1]MDV3130130.1 TetR/AcrR family transcriptional regulator [Mycobacterium sp. 21AC1]